MKTEKIEIDTRYGKEYAGKYVFSEISWAKRSRIVQRHTKYHPITGQIVSSDFIAIQAETILASLKEQPENKPITMEKLLSEDEGIPIELGELFSRVANRLCGITPEEQRFLSEPLEEENSTQQLRNIDSAKNSGGRLDSLQNSQQKQSKSFS